jgi:hypothetical protein
MAQRNYLPFIRRQRLDIPAQALAGSIGLNFSSIPLLATEGGIRAHLTDAYVYPDVDNRTDLVFENFRMRMGLTTQSYFTEQFYPIGMYQDGVTHETGCWRFAKPYRIYPGDRLRVQERYPTGWDDAYDVTYPAVIFTGKRLDNGDPILLYECLQSVADAGTAPVFQADTLRCPAETPVDLYSVVTNVPRTLLTDGGGTIRPTTSFGLMIWGPDGRQWWDDGTWTQLMNLNGYVMDLRKLEYELRPDQTLVFEFERIGQDLTARTLWITVRGSYEVLV